MKHDRFGSACNPAFRCRHARSRNHDHASAVADRRVPVARHELPHLQAPARAELREAGVEHKNSSRTGSTPSPFVGEGGFDAKHRSRVRGSIRDEPLAFKVRGSNPFRRHSRCEASKSGAGCHFAAAIGLRSSLEGYTPTVPDWALDQHTLAGRKLGRGLDHFRREGAKLIPEPTEPDPYVEEAYRLWALSGTSEPYRWSADGAALFSFAPCSLPAKPFGVCRHFSSILLNNLVARGTGHQACAGLCRRKHFFSHHALGFTLGRFATAHQLRDPQSNHAVAF